MAADEYASGNTTQLAKTLEFEVAGCPLHLKQRSEDSETAGTGTTVWDASKVLAKYMEKNAKALRLANSRVVELGAGCGLAGIAAACLGADVTLTDLPEINELLSSNAASCLRTMENYVADQGGLYAAPVGSVRVLDHAWADPVDDLEGPYDIILGADTIFVEPMVVPFLTSVDALCSQRTTVLCSVEIRSTATVELFEVTAENDFSFTVQKVPKRKMDAEHCSDYIIIYTLKKKR